MTAPVQTEPRRRGRPVDLEIDQRVTAASLEIFAEVGWQGFNLDAVARRAKVGKAALYRRWPSRESLIIHALADLAVPPEQIQTGSLRGDLENLARHMVRVHLSPLGTIALRVALEARRDPDVFGPGLTKLLAEQVEYGREIVNRWKQQGELPAGTHAWLLFTAMSGTIQQRIMLSSNSRLAEWETNCDDLVISVVDLVLGGIKAMV